MPRYTHAALAVAGSYPALQPAADSLDLAMTAADATNKEQVVLTGKQILVWHNTSAATPRTVTITSIADGGHKRSGDVTTYSVAAGEYGAFGPVEIDGWRQSDGNLYFEASHAEVKFGVLRL